MDKQETIKIIMSLKVTYPKFFLMTDPAEAKVQVDTWHSLFAEEPYGLVAEAVKALIGTLKFPPTIADVKEKIAYILRPQSLSEIEAWHIIRKAVDEYDYYEPAEYNRKIISGLPPLLKRIVGSVNQLREWQDMDRGVFNSVVQSNVMRSYTALVKQEAERSMLPESTKVMMAQIEGTRQKQLEAGA